MEEASLYLSDNPEIGMEEIKAAAFLSEVLERHGFLVDRGLGSLSTAFGARKGDGGPVIAFLAEYDALPGMGHGCGHNLVGAGWVFAAVMLGRFLETSGLAGTVKVLGTPGEENKGGKIILLEEGFFEGVDFVLMAHPSTSSEIGRGGRAITSIKVEYTGRGAHSSNPARGINALSSVIQLFTGWDSLFQSLEGDINSNGIILSGGEADNIIPAYAAAQFSIRGKKVEDVEKAVERFRAAAQGAAAFTGATCLLTEDVIYAERYPSMIMEKRWGAYMEAQGEKVTTADPEGRYGSSDIGNVSIRFPAIHPYFSVTDEDEVPNAHTPAYAALCRTDRAHQGLSRNTAALASLGRDLLTDEEFRKEVKDEFARRAGPS
jgi:amidohydrolase